MRQLLVLTMLVMFASLARAVPPANTGPGARIVTCQVRCEGTADTDFQECSVSKAQVGRFVTCSSKCPPGGQHQPADTPPGTHDSATVTCPTTTSGGIRRAAECFVALLPDNSTAQSCTPIQ